MDDLEQLFGTKIKTPVEEAWHNEQERKKYDIIRVKNPTNDDFYVQYDINQHQKVPGQSTVDIPRYIALRYITHMKDKIINDKSKKMHDEFLAERRKRGFADFKNKHEENEETYLTSSFPKTDDPVIMESIINELWVGLVYEFGRDIPPNMVDPRSGEVDLTPPEMKIIDSLNKKRVIVAEGERPPVYQGVPTPTYIAQKPIDTIPIQPSGFSAMNDKLSASEITNE